MSKTYTQDALVVDCMGIVNQLKIHADVQTLADLAEQFCVRIETKSRGFGILALVFDRYGTLKKHHSSNRHGIAGLKTRGPIGIKSRQKRL